MKQLFHKISTVFILLLFTAASTGLNFYIHTCSCEEKTFATIFTEHKCHQEATSSCCQTTTNNSINYSESDCGCKTVHLSINIDNTFTYTSYTFESNLFTSIVSHLPSFSKSGSVDNLNPIFFKGLYVPEDSPPVKTTGKVLIHYLHQSKTPDFLS